MLRYKHKTVEFNSGSVDAKVPFVSDHTIHCILFVDPARGEAIVGGMLRIRQLDCSVSVMKQ